MAWIPDLHLLQANTCLSLFLLESTVPPLWRNTVGFPEPPELPEITTTTTTILTIFCFVVIFRPETDLCIPSGLSFAA